MKLTGDWAASVRVVSRAQAGLGRAIDRAVAQEAHMARKEVITGIRKQAPGGQQFTRLSKLTYEIRKAKGFKGRKALIKSGALLQSIAVKKTKQGHYFLGVMRGAKTKEGREIADIASIQEHGAVFVVRVTPKMRKFLMMMLRRAGRLDKRRTYEKGKSPGRKAKGVMSGEGATNIGKRFMVIRIPARPFIAPVIEAIKRNPVAARRRMEERVSKMLGYDLGKV